MKRLLHGEISATGPPESLSLQPLARRDLQPLSSSATPLAGHLQPTRGPDAGRRRLAPACHRRLASGLPTVWAGPRAFSICRTAHERPQSGARPISPIRCGRGICVRRDHMMRLVTMSQFQTEPEASSRHRIHRASSRRPSRINVFASASSPACLSAATTAAEACAWA